MVHSKSIRPIFNFKNHEAKYKNPAGCFMKTKDDTSTCSDSALHGRQVLSKATQESFEVSFCNDDEINTCIAAIKSIFASMDDGEISVSAYDTAWVALIEDVNGSATPQFPSTLQWIANNQLPDGSWGDATVFSAYDRILSTLACVIALRTWNIHPDKSEKGISYFKDNLSKLEDENAEGMTIAFEVLFPSLIEKARRLDLELVPKDSRVLQDIYPRRNLKLTRIPLDRMHNVVTTLLFSLEGIPPGLLEWEKILKLQYEDGSFMSSPSSTAFAFMQTKDENCLRYLNKTIQRFNGAVPTIYPIDVFEQIWVVDRLQRLGISRYFKPDIKKCADHVYRNWNINEGGVSWTRTSSGLPDIDNTNMAFRILRLHGYHVSADVFGHFEELGGGFACYPGESNRSVSTIFNLHRASQVRFPGEKILVDVEKFSSKFLTEKQAANEFQDKWVISKDLSGEVGYAMHVPWYASLPRVETRFYVDQYGGENDAWISKTLYRSPFISNDVYLHLAKLDYNKCQALHCTEWEKMQQWYEECNLKDFGISKTALLLAYFLAAANIFEPERSMERFTWAKTTMLLESFFSADHSNFSGQRRALVGEFVSAYRNGRTPNDPNIRQEIVKVLLGTIHHLSSDALTTYGRDISPSLYDAWEKWLLKWEVEGDRHHGEAELLVRTMNLTSGCSISEESLIHHPQFKQLCNLANRLCSQLGHYQKYKAHENGSYSTTSNVRRITTPKVESGMQELVQLVLQNSADDIDSDVKKSFLAVVKSFYYTAFCNPETINYHIAKVLFESVQ